MLRNVPPVPSSSSCEFVSLNSHLPWLHTATCNNVALRCVLALMNDREDFRKSFKESNPEQKSGPAVRIKASLS